MLRQRSGVVPYFHLPASLSSQGATLALCGTWGTKVTNLGVDQMIRCPLCVLALDMR